MSEIEIRDDCFVEYCEIQDGEALSIKFATPDGVTDEIILIRPVAIELAHVILEMMGDKEIKDE